VKIVTVLGTRPEIIRLSRIVEKLDRLAEHVLVHTGQNFDRQLSDIFFEEMQIRKPNHYLAVTGNTLAGQISQILVRAESIFLQEKPDRLLILGDTNSALCAIVAKRMGISVFHMEAGNRCYDDRVPEEINRRLIDHSSDVLMPYTERSRANLLREGIPGEKVYVTGNPIFEVIENYRAHIERSNVLQKLQIEPRRYFLVTLHRAENVDIESRLCKFAEAFELISDHYGLPVIVSTHPRTRERMRQFGVATHHGDVRFPEPFGFFDFIALEQSACCVLSDSGTVQEECAILGTPNVTLRDVTERPETIECGSNILTGCEPNIILSSVRAVLDLDTKWNPPHEYLVPYVSSTVLRIVLGYDLRTSVAKPRSG
jgi:UDP-N-acetylglucosamine 2-epimerase (non-hydrolysing)